MIARLPDSPEPQPHQLQCMEIWGGHGAAYDAVSAPGLDAWVYSQPHEGGDHGGDVHYLSGCAGGKILRVAVADVAGHGESVSEVARSLRRLMRRSINTPDQSRLAREPFAHRCDRVERQCRQQLDRDLPLMSCIERAPDLAHAAASDELFKPVVPDNRLGSKSER
mgnify:CR=1 FL=1